MGSPTVAARSAPAFATGGRLGATTRIRTASGGLGRMPSSTISCAMYSPARSATKVGWAAPAPGQRGGALLGHGKQRPLECELMTVRVTRLRSVERHQAADRHIRLVGTGVCLGRTVHRRDDHRVRLAGQPAIVHDQLHVVGAGSIGDERRRDAARVVERRGTALRHARQRPHVAQPIAVGIARTRSVERDHGADNNCLVATGNSSRPGVLGADGDGVGLAGRQAIVDDQLRDIFPGKIDDERRRRR